MRLLVLLLVAVASAPCRPSDVEVVFYRNGNHRFSTDEKRTIERIAAVTIAEVRGMLPMLPAQITVGVEAGKNVIPEIGATASAGAPNTIQWTVDPDRPGGVEAIATTQLRAALFHELHHLARDATVQPHGRYIDAVIFEGLATAFERDFAGARPLWGRYPENTDEWVKEILALPPKSPRRDWMFLHPDGRRWVGYKVGTYLVDRATRASGKSALELVSVPTDEILRLAGVSSA